jgi:hypothetical protein
MEPHMAIGLWMRKQLTEQQVYELTGATRTAHLFHEWNRFLDELDDINYVPTAEEMECQELEDLAWQLYQPILAEMPEYLDQVTEKLKAAKQRRLQEFGRRFGARKRARRGSNIIQFPTSR